MQRCCKLCNENRREAIFLSRRPDCRVDNGTAFCYNAGGEKWGKGSTISLEVPRTQGLKRIPGESCNILPREF